MYPLIGISRSLVRSAPPKRTEPNVFPPEELAPLTSLRRPGAWSLWWNLRAGPPVIAPKRSGSLKVRVQLALRHH